MNQTDIEKKIRRDKKCEYLRQYRLQKKLADPDYYNQKQKIYYEKNIDAIKEKTAIYREKSDYYNVNKDRLLAIKREKYRIKMDALKEISNLKTT